MIAAARDSGNVTGSTKSEALGIMEISYEHFEALVVTVSFKRVEARGVAASTFFSRWLVLRAPDFGGVGDARCWDGHRFIQRCTTYRFGGAHW
jgi:hypothetical protein